MLVMYVDDLLILHNNTETACLFNKVLQAEYKCTDKGELGWHLGIKYGRDQRNKTIDASQVQYIDNLLEKTCMTDCK